MAITINGSGTVTGISVGGLPDGIVDDGTLATNAIPLNEIENNIALLAFHRAADNSKAVFNMIDSVVDTFTDATGIDAGNSTNETLTSGYYNGVSGSGGSKTFSYQGSNESWSVPAGVTSIVVKAWGAGGAAGGTNGNGGGGGGYSTAAFTVTAGTSMVGVVGQGGGGFSSTGGTPGTISHFGGGGPGICSTANDATGGAGGGLSGLFVGSYTQANAIIIAGGAGGGGYSGKKGGGGGGTTGNAGVGGSFPGGGGTQSAGGAGGAGSVTNGTAGSALQGGSGGKDANYCAGGGGGGYFGGGGAGTSSPEGSNGSGGGSGFVRTTSFPTGVSASSSSTLTTGSNGNSTDGGLEANSSDSNSSGAGGSDTPGTGSNADAENGAMYVTWSSPAANLTLQSTATTAEATPTTGDIVMLLEDAAGTATLNTDIKGYVSRDGGTTWTQGTLTDEGGWGTNKKVVAFHNLDISAQPSGTSIKYKVTTHNQSASKETRVHATSLAWA